MTQSGQLTGEGGFVGALIVHFTYDGLGRLVRVQRPSSAAAAPEDDARLTITDLHYDGVRVVQEAGWSPVPVRPQTIDGEPAPTMPGLPRLAREMLGADPLPEACEPVTSSNWAWQARRLEREYIWHADPGAYVDECAVQLVYTDAHALVSYGGGEPIEVGDDTSAVTLYCLTDHNANVTGLADAAGNVVAQYNYSPYGEVRAVDYDPRSLASAEAVTAAKGNVLGHQGLRVVRFDRPWDGALDLTSVNTGETGGYRAICHNRNRMYEPAEGRFLSDDPNGLALPVLGETAFGGAALGAGSIAFDVGGHYGDGMNAHVSYLGNPRASRDALGLFAGNYIQGLYVDLLSEYLGRVDFGVDWAGDWEQPEEWNPFTDGGWVATALRDSLVRTTLGFSDLGEEDIEDFIDMLPPVAGATTATVAAGGPPVGNTPLWSPQTHHIATNKSAIWKPRFEALFRRAGVQGPHPLEIKANKIVLNHRGGHPEEVKAWVYKRLNRAVGGLTGAAGRAALDAELKHIGKFLKANPRFLYNTIRGQPTGFKGMRFGRMFLGKLPMRMIKFIRRR